ncbi:hypothetical protein ACV229_36960 [Burkholderia sp. MR1-5-21]
MLTFDVASWTEQFADIAQEMDSIVAHEHCGAMRLYALSQRLRDLSDTAAVDNVLKIRPPLQFDIEH